MEMPIFSFFSSAMASPSIAAGPTIRNPRNLDATRPPSILHLSFNQDGGSFAVGTTDGFMIFNTDPFVQTIGQDLSKNDQGGGIGIVQMILGTNILALVAPGFSRNKIMICYDFMRELNVELNLCSEVKSVRGRRDCIVAVTMQKVSIYDQTELKLLHERETGLNPKGLCEISLSDLMVLVCLGSDKGVVRVEEEVEHYGLSRSRLIKAHNSDVACVALSNDGRLLATASTKGTLVRVFDTSNGTLLHELRRGSKRAEIHSLCFSSDAEWLAVSSNKGTVHVFSLNIGTDGSQEADQNNSSLTGLSSFKGILPQCFSSKRSVAQFRVPEDIRHIVAFGHQKNTVLIIGTNGRFYRCKFDPIAGGEMTLLECHNFLQPDAADNSLDSEYIIL